MNDKEQVVDTYNKSARELAEYFAGIGARTNDIELGLELAGNPEAPRTYEIGCGDGRDAKEIIARSAFYQGMDISDGLIDIANESNPGASFVVGDIEDPDFEMPNDLDVIYSFASLLHSPKEDVEKVLARCLDHLRVGGIFFISLKEMPDYTTNIKEDQYGTRRFYFYNAELIADMAGDGYEVVHQDRQTMGKTDWFTIALKKK